MNRTFWQLLALSVYEAERSANSAINCGIVRSEQVRRLRAVLGRRRSLSVTGAEDLGRRNLEYVRRMEALNITHLQLQLPALTYSLPSDCAK